MDPMQQHAQNVQSMLSSGQLQPGGMGLPPGQPGQPGHPNQISHPGHMGSMPAPPMPMSFQNLSQQQQQQLGSAMNIFNAAAAQGRPPPGSAAPTPPGGPGMPPGMAGQGPPGQTQLGPGQGPMPHPGPPPPMPQINTSDFPFDWRVLPQTQHVRNPEWKGMMQQRNPQGLAAVEQAFEMISSGSVRPETLNRMQQLVGWSKAMAGWHQMNQIWMAQNPGVPPPAGLGPGPGGAPGQGQGPESMQVRPPGFRPPPPQQQRSTHVQPSPVVDPHTQHGRPRSAAGPPGQTPPSGPHAPPGAAIRPDMHPTTWVPGQPQDTPTLQTAVPPAPPAIPVKDWEGHLHMHIPITDITRLPDETPDDPTFGGLLPPLDERAQKEMKAYMDKDLEYAKGLEKVKEGVKKRMIGWAKRSDMETPWWDLRKGERPPMPKGRLTIIWPGDKVNHRAKTSHRGRREIRFSPAQLKTMANVEDHLVPVRLDLEHDHHRLRDTFLWNVSDRVVTPELFAQSMCDDFRVPYAHFGPRIVAAIQERVKEYQDQVLPITARADGKIRGVLEDGDEGESKAIWEVFRRARESSEEVRTDEGAEEEQDTRVRIWGEDEEVMTVEECMRGWGQVDGPEDLRFLVKVSGPGRVVLEGEGGSGT